MLYERASTEIKWLDDFKEGILAVELVMMSRDSENFRLFVYDQKTIPTVFGVFPELWVLSFRKDGLSITLHSDDWNGMLKGSLFFDSFVGYS